MSTTVASEVGYRPRPQTATSRRSREGKEGLLLLRPLLLPPLSSYSWEGKRRRQKIIYYPAGRRPPPERSGGATAFSPLSPPLAARAREQRSGERRPARRGDEQTAAGGAGASRVGGEGPSANNEFARLRRMFWAKEGEPPVHCL